MKTRYVYFLCVAVLATCITVHAGNCLCKKSVSAAYSGTKVECSSNSTSSISAEISGVGSGGVSGEGSMDAVCVQSYEVVPSHYDCYSEGDQYTDCDDDGNGHKTQHNYTGGGCDYDGGLFGIGAHYDCTDLTDSTSNVDDASGTACSE